MANKIDLTDAATAFYKLDDDLATGVILDDTTSNNAAMSSGNSQDLHSDLSKTGTGAFDISDGSDFIVAPPSIITGSEFSIALWANDNLTFTNQDGRLFAVKSDVLELLLLRSSVGAGDQLAVRVAGTATPNATGITRGEWHLYILTHGSDKIARLYVDNVLETSTATATTFSGLSDDLYIGATSDGGGSKNFEGRIDGVMIFDRELTSVERSALYANGRGVDSLIMNPADFFPPDRDPAYDPDKVWDEETKLWYEPNTAIGADNLSRGSGRFGNKLIAVSDEGSIYFEDY